MKKLITLATLLLLTTPIMAQSGYQSPPKPKCISEDGYRKHIEQKFGDVFLVNLFMGEQAQKFIAAYNEMPPTSNIKGTSILALGKAERKTVLLAVFDKQCMIRKDFMGDRAYQELITEIGEKRAQLL